jgi:hypothetical protein
METNNQDPKVDKPEIPSENNKANGTADGLKMRRKRKPVSALVAASLARSAVANTASDAYRENGFPDTGTNLTYREGQ